MEIERKFLVNKDLWRELSKPEGEHILQGYITSGMDKSIRIRLTGEQAWLTIKGKTVNLSREEYEFPLPADIAASVIEKFSEGKVEKVRYKIHYKRKTWEVDEFLGENEGLVVAEVELESEQERVELPAWVGEEVSYDPRYYNAVLIKKPFKTW